MSSSKRQRSANQPEAFNPKRQQVPGRHVLIIGGKRVAQRIQQALESEGIEVVRSSETERASQLITDTTIAVIAIPPLVDGNLVTTCKKLVIENPKTSLFVACGPTSDTTLKKLYAAGVSSVFFWPQDREPLVRTMYCLSRPTQASRKKRDPQEVALQELVTSHLRTESTVFGKRLRVTVSNRYVFLAGHVDALWKVGMAETVAGDVSGVEDVFSDAVLVSGHKGLSDRSIAAAVRQVLRHTNDIDTSTLAITVKNGVLSLAGTASSRNELRRVVDLMSHVRGVQKIEDWAAVTLKGKRRDQQVAKAVREAIAVRYPRSKIEVAVFGDIAVLSGKVKKLSERRDIEALALRQGGVWNVVDKLRVAKKSVAKKSVAKKGTIR